MSIPESFTRYTARATAALLLTNHHRQLTLTHSCLVQLFHKTLPRVSRECLCVKPQLPPSRNCQLIFKGTHSHTFSTTPTLAVVVENARDLP